MVSEETHGLGPTGVFLGTFTPKLDDKGRLILPAKFRGRLAPGLVATRGLDRCVFLFPVDEFMVVHDRLRRAPLENKQARDYLRNFLGHAQDDIPDKQGRLLLSGALRDYAGLWHTRPALAALMTVCLLSLGGLPPTAGFIGKWYIFSAAVSAGYYWLAIIGVLTSVVSVFFYLRVVVMMYMADREAGLPAPAAIPGVGMAALMVAIIAIVYLGVLPTRVLDFAAESIATIF